MNVRPSGVLVVCNSEGPAVVSPKKSVTPQQVGSVINDCHSSIKINHQRVSNDASLPTFPIYDSASSLEDKFVNTLIFTNRQVK